MPSSLAQGVLADRQLLSLTKQQRIVDFALENVQPASLDLAVTGTVCEVAALPSLGSKGSFHYTSFTEQFSRNCFSLAQHTAVLSPGSVYLAPLQGEFRLPANVYGYANPKSSMGRIDVHCILITEHGQAFNSVPVGYAGKLYVLLIPQTFPIVLTEGDTVVQLRLFQGERQFLRRRDMLAQQKATGLVAAADPSKVLTNDGILLHLDLSGTPSNLVGQTNGRPIHLARRDQNPEGYFVEKPLYGGYLFLEPDQFLLATTIERVRVAPELCAEMVPFREEYGELRTHYAGFFDPGFGYGTTGEVPDAGVVCEIRNIGKAPLMLTHGQPIGLLRYEKVMEKPERTYGGAMLGIASHYQQQSGVRLAKYFAPWS